MRTSIYGLGRFGCLVCLLLKNKNKNESIFPSYIGQENLLHILRHYRCMLMTALTIGTKLPVWKAQQSSPSLWIRATIIRKYFIIASSLRSFGSSNATCTIRWYFVTRARTYGWTCTIRWYFVTRDRTYCWSFPFNNDLKIIFKI